MAVLFLDNKPMFGFEWMQEKLVNSLKIESIDFITNDIKRIQFENNQYGKNEVVIAKWYNSRFIFLNNLILYRK